MRKFFWSFLEVFETVIIAVIAVVLIRSFVAQPFLVSGSSMEPSFHHGDYLLVDELTYNFRQPQRGEVVVFRDPSSSERPSFFIKRIIGLPGEEVVIEGGAITIKENSSSIVIEEDYVINDKNPRKYEITLSNSEYFVMGDNRGFSYDSRTWGPLHEEAITGVVRLRLWPLASIRAIGAPAY